MRASFHRPRDGDGGATLSGDWRLNVTDRLDLIARASGETQNTRFPSGDRTLASGIVGFAYQDGASFDAEVATGWRRVHTPGALEFDEITARARAGGVVSTAQYDVDAQYVDRSGKYDVRNASVRLELAIPLADRLLLQGHADARHEFGGGVREHREGGAVSFFARRVRLSRRGASARQAIEAAHAARDSGYFERASFRGPLDPSHRALRQRLSLRANGNDRLTSLADSLHAAEIDDRAVPLVSASFEASSVHLSGESSRVAGLGVALPWPAKWTFSAREQASRFLRLDLSRRRTAYGADLVSITKSIGLTLELHRELDLKVAVVHADPTPIERVRGFGSYRIFSVETVYAYGR